METATAVGAGIFLLACGASALNQYQERIIDARMPRTCMRPLPSGRLSSAAAAVFALLAAGAGAALVGSGGGWIPSAIAVGAVVWYNGVYTLLKRKTAFALVPGALSGALPPAVGWVSAGGSWGDPALAALCLFFAIWQVPHFWLLMMRYGREYAAAGLPSLTGRFAPEQMSRLVFLWICATAVSCLMLCFYGLATALPVRYLMLGASVLLVGQGVFLLVRGESYSRAVFGGINSYMIVILALLASDRFFLGGEFGWLVSEVAALFTGKCPSCFL